VPIYLVVTSHNKEKAVDNGFMIEVKNLKKSYGNTRAVDDITFSMKKGEVLGFLGPNGAGKSTTMKVLTCFIPADSGEAKVAGYDVFSQHLEVREKIGYLPENTPLYMDMEVAEFLGYVTEIRKVAGDGRKAAIQRVTDLCGLKGVLRKPIGELSKGYRQRVGLAMAMIHDPEILILDEPTSGLDPKQIIEIRELIKGIGKEKTVILCSHILPEVAATCGRVLIINEGKIVADGSPDELAKLSHGEETVVVNYQEGNRQDIQSRLEAMEGVLSHKILSESDKNTHRFEIKTDRGESLCRELFQCAVENKWVMTELHLDKLSLEDVFLHLTTKEKTV
jgi:ABC-2 type transport system ATP-binding protein